MNFESIINKLAQRISQLEVDKAVLQSEVEELNKKSKEADTDGTSSTEG